MYLGSAEEYLSWIQYDMLTERTKNNDFVSGIAISNTSEFSLGYCTLSTGGCELYEYSCKSMQARRLTEISDVFCMQNCLQYKYYSSREHPTIIGERRYCWAAAMKTYSKEFLQLTR